MTQEKDSNPKCYYSRPHCCLEELRGINPLTTWGWRSIFKREYILRRACKVFFTMMFWRVDLGLPHYLWLSMELMVNLPQLLNGFPNSFTLIKFIDSQSSNYVYLHMRVVEHTFLYSWKKIIIIKVWIELNIKIKVST